jgi:hypothetical protein
LRTPSERDERRVQEVRADVIDLPGDREPAALVRLVGGNLVGFAAGAGVDETRSAESGTVAIAMMTITTKARHSRPHPTTIPLAIGDGFGVAVSVMVY